MARDIRIWLSLGELQLVDWCFCGYSRVLPDSLDDLIEVWGPLRRKIWDAIIKADAPETPIYFDESDCKILLALLPTTFHWGGAGEDVGYSLKRKIALWERGKYDNNASDKASDAASSNPEDKTDDPA